VTGGREGKTVHKNNIVEPPSTTPLHCHGTLNSAPHFIPLLLISDGVFIVISIFYTAKIFSVELRNTSKTIEYRKSIIKII